MGHQAHHPNLFLGSIRAGVLLLQKSAYLLKHAEADTSPQAIIIASR